MLVLAPANEKQQAHQFLDQLAAGQLAAVVHLLQVMTGPLSRSQASAPVEEEEITPETAATLDRARADLCAIDRENRSADPRDENTITICAVRNRREAYR